MAIESALTHPIFQRARRAALERTDLRFNHAPAAEPGPAAPVRRLSNAPVRLVTTFAVTAPLYTGAIPPAPPMTPTEVPPPPSPPLPEPAAPEITDIPPDSVPVPVREPPVMPQPIAA